MTRARTFALAATALCFAGACAVIAGIDEPVTRPAVDAATGDGSDVDGASPLDDAAQPVEASTGDCNARVADDLSGIFVAPNGADGVGCGTRAQPCASIQGGLTQASTLGKTTVYVATGTYVGSISLVAGVSVEGGWSISGTTTWSPVCNDAGTGSIVQAPDDAGTAITADGINGSATLRLLEIRTQPTAAARGGSVYGVLARGATTNLALDRVWITVDGAGDGASGAAGTPGENALDAGCTDASVALQGGRGASSDGGRFASNGYAPGDGLRGEDGQQGAAGSPPGSPACASNCGTCKPGNCFFTALNNTVCGKPGFAGCGGFGGGGGAGGGGGGSAIALYVWDAHVTCTGSVLHAGPGGAGAQGGPGADGGSPTSGTAGTAGSCIVGCGNVCNDAGCPFCQSTTTTESGGTAGGVGEVGAGGGAGGGGAGGWSCGIFVGGSGSANVDDASTTIVVSDAGGGGAPSGVPGRSSERCPP